MNFMQHTWNEFHRCSYREVKLDYDSSPFLPSEHWNAFYAIPAQFIDSLILSVGNSHPALSKKARQRSAILFLLWDSLKRCNRSSTNPHYEPGIKTWTTYVWEEIRKSQQEKEENQEYCQFFLQYQAKVTPCRCPGQSDIVQICGKWQAELLTMLFLKCTFLILRELKKKKNPSKQTQNRHKPYFILPSLNQLNQNFCPEVLSSHQNQQ